MPEGPLRGYALFAHCFTCPKDLFAARHIAQSLAQYGFAVLRFDFTGLSWSEGEFANTNFSSNAQDLLRAADIPEVRGVATIGVPSDVGHVLHKFGGSLDEIC